MAKAQGEATRIRGEADAEAAKSFDILKQNPDLAIFLLNVQALEKTLNKGSTIIADPRTPPFNLLVPPGNVRSENQNTNDIGRVLSANGEGK